MNLAVVTIWVRFTWGILQGAATFAHDHGMCARFSQP